MQDIFFIQVRSQREETALERAFFSRAAGGCFAVEKIDCSVPAVRKFIILSTIFFPADPVLFTIEQFVFSWEQINTKIILVAQITGIGLAAAGAAGGTAKLSAILIQRRNFVKKSIYGQKCDFSG